MITAKPVSALPGVYKLVEDNFGPRIKLSDSKKTHPGKKQLCRIESKHGYLYDILQLEDEPTKGKPLLEKVAANGCRTRRRRTLKDIREYSIECVSKLPEQCRKIRDAEPYSLRISERLQILTDELTRLYSK